jgi:hypothetical protein
MKTIKLKNGGETTVDDDDFEKLSKYSWHKNSFGYIVRCEYVGRTLSKNKKVTILTKSFFMSREIMSAPSGMQVDHIDGNKTNNTKQNLRNVTQHQNLMNKGIYKNNKTGYKGVTIDKNAKLSNRPYRATIKANGKKISLGYYATPEEAARVYDEQAKKYFGEFARTNF